MKNPFSNFNEEEFERFLERYYSENVKSLLHEFGIEVSAAYISDYLPPKQLAENCPLCNEALMVNRMSKSQVRRKEQPIPYCNSCGHQISSQCTCNTCKEIKLENLEKIRAENRQPKSIKDFIFPKKSVQIFENYNFKKKIILGALINEFISEDENLVKGFPAYSDRLAPNDYLNSEYLNIIASENFFDTNNDWSSISQLTRPEYFEKIKKYLNLKLNIESDSEIDLKRVIRNFSQGFEITTEELSPALEFWQEINAHEAIAYFLKDQQNMFKGYLPVEKNMINLFIDLVRRYTIGEVHSLIYTAGNLTARECLEKQIVLSQCLYRYQENLEGYAVHASRNSYVLRSINRVSNYKASVVAKYFFSKILKLPDDGYNIVPSINHLRNLLNSEGEL
ncbi:hypothetical protein MM239_11040 [Belliella sp. DSM 111904]|uniref:Transposase n=1 Tax=Belliella filtrata TaxID=2923435 RepID=A0ABS9V1S2_9BACT|nr:hypothetical protein [Belliella filtrata]MCH7409930.1 hypothetical protein [Belliella filtrata]